MGNDGTNHLTILGPPGVLDKIVNMRVAVPRQPNEPEYYERLRTDYFAKSTFKRADVNCLRITYDFRNQVPEDYLEDLLKTHPTIWMKNEFDSEEGLCGVWIGQMVDGRPQIQRNIWRELGWQEGHCFGRDE